MDKEIEEPRNPCTGSVTGGGDGGGEICQVGEGGGMRSIE